VVRDHVVELAGDPYPLGGGGPGRRRSECRLGPGSVCDQAIPPAVPRTVSQRSSRPLRSATVAKPIAGASGSGANPNCSGANNCWLWGPPPAADTAVVAIGVRPALLHREFSRVTRVAVWNNGLGVADDEQDTPVYIATGRLRSWAAAWPAFRGYS
jgi:hypothetical protein